MQKKKQVNDLFVKNGMDVPFFLIMLVLMTIGLVMLLSASYIYAFHNSGSGDSLYYFKQGSFICEHLKLFKETYRSLKNRVKNQYICFVAKLF